MSIAETPALRLEGGTITRRFTENSDRLVHEIAAGCSSVRTDVDRPTPRTDPQSDWWRAYLHGQTPRAVDPGRGRIRVMELFCGAGGLANGFRQACTELGLEAHWLAAADQDEEALNVFRANHGALHSTSRSISTLVDFQVRGPRSDARFVYPPEVLHPDWQALTGRIDVVLAGPPCQGHSNLNNRTRRADPRNELYLTVPAAAVALGASIIVIENVPAVVHDRLGVVAATRALLEKAGYEVETGTVHAARMGWPQTRSRYFVVARRDAPPIDLSVIQDAFRGDPRSVMWAIEDLADDEDDLISEPILLSAENRRRIDWLFDNDAHDLPLVERPVCHQDGTRYQAVYGRLYADRPAPTITTGFMTPGRGRYIHPTRRRVLTTREAARLQGFADSFTFRTDACPNPSKKSLAKWIGDAVPMPLGYAAGIAALGAGPP